MTSDTFEVHAISPTELDAVRSKGSDASGNPLVPLHAEGGEALRCCLRPAIAGESLLLFGYEAAIPAAGSPYREVGAIITHADSCAGPSDNGYPAEWKGRPQVLRAYDARGWIHDATRVHDGTSPHAVLEEMPADPSVAEIHSRNIGWGCYMFRVTRTGQ